MLNGNSLYITVLEKLIFTNPTFIVTDHYLPLVSNKFSTSSWTIFRCY